ncbi:gustatory receptor 23a isoform X1 [Drosophila albomicans]|uniref:Gustatory receptor n=1 Tax=Drosophila albomicans TaxID=7291 RepID=A0A6P8XMS6_DROAB|nr:gustatory receptor 23a isoform X1 [Drosophila albomicans]
MKSFECLTARCLQVVYWLMGLLPLPPGSQFIRLLFALLLRCIWSLYFYIMIYSGIKFLWKEQGLTISYITGSALFLGYSMLGVLLQIESIFKQRSQERLQDLRFQSQLQMQRLAMSRGCPRRALRLFVLIVTQLVSDAAKFWANSRAKVSPVLAITMPQMWLLRIRYVQLLEQVIEMNQRALQLRHSLLCLADSNDIWQPFGQQDRHLQTLRLTYDCIFECYLTFSDCYGWGMLGLQVMCGFEFVSNAYWIITEAYQDQQLYMLVYNSATCFAMGSLITSLFWYGDASTQNSRQIGCLISKLVKPLGSKRYNDLVCEFLLQTLHQRFVLTAKDFFSLNLHLLSSMCAAVVTYLVILIQFMFAEKSSQVVSQKPETETETSTELNKLE